MSTPNNNNNNNNNKRSHSETTPSTPNNEHNNNNNPKSDKKKKKKQKTLKNKLPVALQKAISTNTTASTPTPTKKRSNEKQNSLNDAEQLFEWLVSPMKPEDFYKEYWGKKHLVVKRGDRSYFAGVFSKEDMNNMFRKCDMKYSVNVDVTNYVDGERQTLNPEGRVNAGHVWKMYEEGCSVRLLNPQTFNRKLWRILSTLQEHFCCGMGANTYLTPKGAQGFAPHYDDVDVFILQTEGSKMWRLYEPITESEVLAKVSSRNFSQDEIGEPILEVTLEAGDLLYFPRGVIHQAVSPEEEHSLHVTISTYMNNTWGDLLAKAIPRALEIANEEDVEFRKGLPINYMHYMGILHSEKDKDERRRSFIEHMGKLFDKLSEYLPFDAAADQMSIKFIHDSLPPILEDDEIDNSVFGGDFPEINERIYLRLVRGLVCRMVIEPECVALYHSVENTRVYHAEPEPCLIEFSKDCAPALEAIINCYEDGFIQLKELPHEDDPTFEQRIDVVSALYEKGLLLLKKTDD